MAPFSFSPARMKGLKSCRRLLANRPSSGCVMDEDNHLPIRRHCRVRDAVRQDMVEASAEILEMVGAKNVRRIFFG
jgi:hypothetical protein